MRRKNIKNILCAGVLALTLVGCSNSSTSNNEASKDTSIENAKADSYADTSEEDVTADTLGEESGDDVTQTYTASEEILNAELSSLKVQFMDTIFTTGVTTGKEFVETCNSQNILLPIDEFDEDSLIVEKYSSVEYAQKSLYGDFSATFWHPEDGKPVKLFAETVDSLYLFAHMEDDVTVNAGLFFLPKGIAVGVSTYEDVINAYGEPNSNGKVDAGWYYMVYEFGENRYKINLNMDVNTVIGFDIDAY